MQHSKLRFPVLKDLSNDPCFNRWLSKYGSAATRSDFAYCLCRFLRWLAEEKGVKVAPSELITWNLQNVHESKATEVFKKRVHTDWLEEYVFSSTTAQVRKNHLLYY